MKNKEKEPLYRKVNTKARGCHHQKTVDYSYRRNKKVVDEKMTQGVRRGLDYTPLFRFLLSRVGKNWDEVYSEVKARIDKEEPIFWMVQNNGRKIFDATSLSDRFRNENAYFNTLYVNEDNLLSVVDNKLTVNDVFPQCECCTYTFNGKAVVNKPLYLQDPPKVQEE